MNNHVVYVGGATVGFYINDPAADDVRPTKDVDISLSIATLLELEQTRQELNQKGFVQTADDDVICRFRYDDVKVDVMNTKALGWAPANPWFAPGFALREKVVVENQQIYILPLPYFLATKFAAYNDRGRNEPRTSHDFEDIVYVLDNRLDITEQIRFAPGDVKPFLEKEFTSMLHDRVKQEAIYGNLFYESREDRFNLIKERLTLMTNHT
jgi:hypothetical protein